MQCANAQKPDYPPTHGSLAAHRMITQSKVRVLLVDDQPANLVVLENVLADHDYELVRAGSGAEALRQLLLGEFAVVILDVLMPGLDGFETAKLIQQRAKSRMVPIIFLTAYQRNELDIIDGYAAGAVDFLSKPIDPIILQSKIAVFVKLFRQTEELHILNEALLNSQRELSESNGRLRDNNAMLDSFAYSISHDLRAPLRHALAFSSMLWESCQAQLSVEDQRRLHLVQDSVKRMSKMIDNLLGFCRACRSKYRKGQSIWRQLSEKFSSNCNLTSRDVR